MKEEEALMFCDKLKELRLKRGLTQKELGKAIYVSRSAICKWEMGNGIPNDVNLTTLCTSFDVAEEWLLDREDLKERVIKYEGLWKLITLSIFGVVIAILCIVLSFTPYYKPADDSLHFNMDVLQSVRYLNIISVLDVWIVFPFLLYLGTFAFSLGITILSLGKPKLKITSKLPYILIILLSSLSIIVYLITLRCAFIFSP
jgi:transcriptional regulator with XRE-family HTH domain